MPNKYEKLTEPHKIINNIFANVNAGMEAGKKPADKQIEEYEKSAGALFKDMDKGNDKFFKAIDSVKRKKVLDPYIKTLIDKIEGLERKLKRQIGITNKAYSLVGDLHNELGELKAICTTDQLANLAYVMMRKREDNNKGGK